MPEPLVRGLRPRSGLARQTFAPERTIAEESDFGTPNDWPRSGDAAAEWRQDAAKGWAMDRPSDRGVVIP